MPNDEVLENTQEVEETVVEEVEQPDEGTPEQNPEYALDDDGNLVWNDGEQEEESNEDSVEEQPDEPETPVTDEEQELPIYKVKINGEEKEIPLDELIAGYSRQSDYTRKMQELAEQRKALLNPPTPQEPQTVPVTKQDDIALAKQIAAKRLGVPLDDLSELNFEHNVAVFEAVQSIENQRREVAQRQSAIKNLETSLQQEDPAYNEIITRVGEKLQDLPHKDFVRLQQAYANGDTAPLKEYYDKERKKYYAEKVQSSVVPKKVPKVESSNNTPLERQPKKIDFRSIGRMSSDQKAQMLIDLGLVD